MLLTAQSYHALAVTDELHWNDFVTLIGGELVAPLISQEHVKNADYLFREWGLVVELKMLEEDLTDHPGFCSKISDAIDDNINAENSPNAQTHRIDKVIERKLDDIIKKANRQIKETKINLHFNSYKGVIILINAGFMALPLNRASDIVRRLIGGRHYSSVNGVIYIEAWATEIDDEISINASVLMNRSTSKGLVEKMLAIWEAWLLYTENPDIRFRSRDGDLYIRFDKKLVKTPKGNRFALEASIAYGT